jgi:hypothetical protein
MRKRGGEQVDKETPGSAVQNVFSISSIMLVESININSRSSRVGTKMVVLTSIHRAGLILV